MCEASRNWHAFAYKRLRSLALFMHNRQWWRCVERWRKRRRKTPSARFFSIKRMIGEVSVEQRSLREVDLRGRVQTLYVWSVAGDQRWMVVILRRRRRSSIRRAPADRHFVQQFHKSRVVAGTFRQGGGIFVQWVAHRMIPRSVARHAENGTFQFFDWYRTVHNVSRGRAIQGSGRRRLPRTHRERQRSCCTSTRWNFSYCAFFWTNFLEEFCRGRSCRLFGILLIIIARFK